ncbi:MAG: VWA domain-containing protein [Acidobacteriota bacterium]|nr:VWA domain-containing protein [Acidobacteriota bacterium]
MSGRLCLLFFFYLPLTAQNHVELILDASGSMYNRIEDGRYRITAAKDALRTFIAGLPDTGVNVGLRVYGAEIKAGRDGACTDSVLKVPVKGCDKAALLRVIDETRALGSTPIAYSLDQATADFPDSGRRLIVLVTDGKEQCDGDPAAVAARLKEKGIELRIIGFDLDRSAAEGFAALATFQNARDAKELAQALGKAVEKTLPPPEPLGQASLEAVAEVTAGSLFEVTWKAEPKELDYITIVPKEAADGVYNNWSYVTKGNPLQLRAPGKPGAYQLRYQSDRVAGVAARRAITVKEAKAVLEAPETVPAGALFTVRWTGPNNDRDYITLVAPDAPDGSYKEYDYTRKGRELNFHGPMEPGAWELRYQSESVDGVFARLKIQVVPSQFHMEYPAEVEAGKPFQVSWIGPAGKGDYLTVVKPDLPDGQYGEYQYTRKNPVTFNAPVGEGSYEIRYQSERVSGVFARFPLKVKGIEIKMDFPKRVEAGKTFEVTWKGPAGNRDYLTIVKADAPDGQYGEYHYTRENPLTFTAPKEAGIYEMRYQSDRVSGVYARSRFEVY